MTLKTEDFSTQTHRTASSSFGPGLAAFTLHARISPQSRFSEITRPATLAVRSLGIVATVETLPREWVARRRVEVTETADAAGKFPAKRRVGGVAGGTIFAAGAPPVEGAAAVLHVVDWFWGNRYEGVRERSSGITKGHTAEPHSEWRCSGLLKWGGGRKVEGEHWYRHMRLRAVAVLCSTLYMQHRQYRPSTKTSH